MPLKASERGCLVMADIAGYTGLLAGSELEHAHDALRDLLQTVIGELRPRFRLGKLEGDAAFLYVVTERLDGSQLLDTLEAAYFAFRRRLESISRATTCNCNACIRIPALDLKLIAHHGSFVRERMYGVEELTGTDVVVVHRLLKNSVAERIGTRGYLLLTDRCLEAAGLDPKPLGLVEHRETYAELGEVRAWLHDLEAAWQRERERRRVVISDRDTLFTVEADLPVPRQVVWSLVTDPSTRPRWNCGRRTRGRDGERRQARRRHDEPLRPRGGCQSRGDSRLAAARLLHHAQRDAGRGELGHDGGAHPHR